MTHWRRTRLAAVAAATALAAAPAAAQPASAQDQAVAQALFDEARALTAAGKHSEACPKLAESQRLDPSIGTQYYLAECFETTGRTASAWTLYVQVADLAEGSGQAERAKYARGRARRLAPSLVRLSIQVPAALRAVPDLRVERDGSMVGAPQWGAAVPVDPGRHEVVVTAPGKQPWRREVDATRPGETITVEVPPLVDAPSEPHAPPSPSSPRGGGARSSRPSPGPVSSPGDAAPGATQRTLGLIVAGVGLAAAGVGTGFGVHAMARRDASNDGHCDARDLCDAEGLRLRAEALDAARVSTMAFIGAGVALAGGAVLFFTAPSGREPATARVGVSIGPTGARVVGRF